MTVSVTERKRNAPRKDAQRLGDTCASGNPSRTCTGCSHPGFSTSTLLAAHLKTLSGISMFVFVMRTCQFLNRRYLFLLPIVGTTTTCAEEQTAFPNSSFPLMWFSLPKTANDSDYWKGHFLPPILQDFQQSQHDPLHPRGTGWLLYRTEQPAITPLGLFHPCRMFPPAVGLLLQSVSRPLPGFGAAGDLASWITYFLPCTIPLH